MGKAAGTGNWTRSPSQTHRPGGTQLTYVRQVTGLPAGEDVMGKLGTGVHAQSCSVKLKLRNWAVIKPGRGALLFK